MLASLISSIDDRLVMSTLLKGAIASVRRSRAWRSRPCVVVRLVTLLTQSLNRHSTYSVDAAKTDPSIQYGLSNEFVSLIVRMGPLCILKMLGT